MSSVDNSKLIAEFCPDGDDGDTFVYTEMLDRSNRRGNNGNRLVKSFFHRSKDEFWKQWPTIKELCDMTQTRAYTRLAPRSFKKVGKEFLVLVAEAAAQENWNHMKALYNSACGRTGPIKKLWLFDVDDPDDDSRVFGTWLQAAGHLVGTIPSKSGLHYISNPFDPRLVAMPSNISLHKDNPTNLYIPEEAE
jgi:hypothetical protein